jgi:hypothetical protein
LAGNLTGMTFESSVRDIARIIGALKASPNRFYQNVGYQVERFLAPGTELEEMLGFKAEAPGLLRHAEAQTQTNQNLRSLREHLVCKTDLLKKVSVNTVFKGYSHQGVSLLSGNEVPLADRLTLQYIASLWPGMEMRAVINWISGLTADSKREISSIIFKGQDNYKELSELARVSSLSLINDASLGEVRDLNRQKAQGRFTDLPSVFGDGIDVSTACQILAKGFGLSIYLTDVQEFESLGESFRGDLEGYYKHLYEFIGLAQRKFGDSIDYSFILNLLPLAHKVDFVMHPDPRQALYYTHQRVRGGGHINYRMLAYLSNQLIADSDPGFEGLRLKEQPKLSDRTEFFDRS